MSQRLNSLPQWHQCQHISEGQSMLSITIAPVHEVWHLTHVVGIHYDYEYNPQSPGNTPHVLLCPHQSLATFLHTVISCRAHYPNFVCAENCPRCSRIYDCRRCKSWITDVSYEVPRTTGWARCVFRIERSLSERYWRVQAVRSDTRKPLLSEVCYE